MNDYFHKSCYATFMSSISFLDTLLIKNKIATIFIDSVIGEMHAYIFEIII